MAHIASPLPAGHAPTPTGSVLEPAPDAGDTAVRLLLDVSGEALESTAVDEGDGVGLLRTEFLFRDRAEPPTRDEQTAAYAGMFAAVPGRPLTVRVLNPGAGGPVPARPRHRAGTRSAGHRDGGTVHLCRELLVDQLAAIAAAARETGADVGVMAPMVSTPGEAGEFADLARAQGVTRAGVMIQVPAAALLADRLLYEVDFVTVCATDLARYTMAVDRAADFPPGLLDPWQPALLSLIGAVGLAGRSLHVPVGVCGDAVTDPLLALVLVGLGATGLSMAAPALPAVRDALSRHTPGECRRLAGLALGAGSARARQAVRAAARTAAAGARSRGSTAGGRTVTGGPRHAR
ncbi:putative PEP-binding protein [Nocardiopsis sp. CC223A]|uniref:putative PEP-binding protein n=1 Tax=Nocardiopsis sp. CC223A TaxID=3044051 RepID=UPI00278C79D7|nr:putative PEP-binding protein [Nocardiopsis sp. CC223A]